MINYVVCDLFLSPATVLVNTVNTVGVMGKGIAKDFKRIYPKMFREYQELCERQLLEVGKLHLFKTSNKWVLNFPTKKHWREPSRVEYIRAGLEKFVETYHRYGITFISFPQLGCGNGELDWDFQVRPVMEEYLGPLPITVFVHLANVSDPFTPEHYDIAEIKQWLRREPQSLAFSEVWDDLAALLREPLHLETCDNREPFQAHIEPSSQDIILTTLAQTHRIPQDALTELWQMVRQSGFVAGVTLPGGLHEVFNYLTAVLTQLSYLSPVMMSDHHGLNSHNTLGLRLQPRPMVVGQPTLFDAVAVVEPVSVTNVG